MDAKKIAKGIDLFSKMKSVVGEAKELLNEFAEKVEEKVDLATTSKSDSVIKTDGNKHTIDASFDSTETIIVDGIEIKIKNFSGNVNINVVGATEIKTQNGNVNNEGNVERVRTTNGKVSIIGEVKDVKTTNGNVTIDGSVATVNTKNGNIKA